MWKYKVGFDINDAKKILGDSTSDNEIQKLLEQHHFDYTYETPKDVFERIIPTIIGAEYKNPSIMQKDAPKAFSCSSLVSYLATMAGMPWMPSITADKYVYLKPIKKEDLSYGDLIFSNSGEGKIYYESIEWRHGTPIPEGVDHVGIYMGDNKVLHSSKTINSTNIQNIDDSVSFNGKIVGYRRIADINTKRYCVIIPDDKSDLFNANSFLKYLAHAKKDDDIAYINDIPYISQLIDIKDSYWTNRACGGVCLAMAFSYLGKTISDLEKYFYEAEEKGYFKQTYGWYHQGLVNLAKESGFDAYRSEGGTVEDLVKEIEEGSVPILSVHKRLFGTKRSHLVVVTGFVKNTVGKIVGFYINDPERLYYPKDRQYVSTKLLEMDWTRRYVVIKKNA